MVDKPNPVKIKQAKLLKMVRNYPISKMIPFDKNPRINEDAVIKVANSIKTFGKLDPIVLDENNRICCGVEIDPIYCDVVVKRWEKYTGNKAILYKSS